MASKIIHRVDRPGGVQAVYRQDETGHVTRTVEKARKARAPKPEPTPEQEATA
ncbi:hypothetical protein [Cellulosimicrobium arenosum]|uniref:Uncharacterized protein n=1 Tax=Cellulosimicrobium arenosum TaxID=2708133 RepID=A0A927IWJ8_9MICO|nr:hypothetical protein [Cellulosimicrobium arenosum]MBD8077691.1 hypothetical protein [Cellulosimicrobium arenosum]